MQAAVNLITEIMTLEVRTKLLYMYTAYTVELFYELRMPLIPLYYSPKVALMFCTKPTQL